MEVDEIRKGPASCSPGLSRSGTHQVPTARLYCVRFMMRLWFASWSACAHPGGTHPYRTARRRRVDRHRAGGQRSPCSARSSRQCTSPATAQFTRSLLCCLIGPALCGWGVQHSNDTGRRVRAAGVAGSLMFLSGGLTLWWLTAFPATWGWLL